ncbi:hypothetical protein DOS73_08580 [Staphylococcus felis]|nr:hypothetical protein DOS73_08580 [Staphylococcus felis]
MSYIQTPVDLFYLLIFHYIINSLIYSLVKIRKNKNENIYYFLKKVTYAIDIKITLPKTPNILVLTI